MKDKTDELPKEVMSEEVKTEEVKEETKPLTEEEKKALKNPGRNEGEDFEHYRTRRYINNIMDKARAKGYWFWKSKNVEDLRKGKTFIKKDLRNI